MSICEPCKAAADAQLGGKKAPVSTDHPKDCGCYCQHRNVGTVEFERPK